MKRHVIDRYHVIVETWGAERLAWAAERRRMKRTIEGLRAENARLREGKTMTRPESTVDQVLHTGYATWWAVVWIAAVVGEIVGWGPTEWLAWLVVFGAVELVAAIRRGRGDTWSEISWFLQGGKMARGLMAAWIGAYLAWRVYSIMDGAVSPGWVGPGVLGAGVASWLIPHFYFAGQKG